MLFETLQDRQQHLIIQAFVVFSETILKCAKSNSEICKQKNLKIFFSVNRFLWKFQELFNFSTWNLNFWQWQSQFWTFSQFPIILLSESPRYSLKIECSLLPIIFGIIYASIKSLFNVGKRRFFLPSYFETFLAFLAFFVIPPNSLFLSWNDEGLNFKNF